MKRGKHLPFPADVSELPLYGVNPHHSRLPTTWLTCLVLLGFLAFHARYNSLVSGTSFLPLKRPRNPAYLVKARSGAVASENKLCSDIGVDVLKEGGNAVDSAIATTVCIGVVNMFSSGLGGGGFMTVRIPSSSPGKASDMYTIDFKETAPSLANATMYVGTPESSKFGGLAVGVPGELRGLEEAHRRWGTLSWKRLIEPSIALAQGWKVDRELAKRITWYPDLMLKNPEWSAIFAPTGKVLRQGEVIHRMNLSLTLAMIANEGPYRRLIVRKIQQTGGILTHTDLENYTVQVRPALQGVYKGRKVFTSHAPTSGPVLLHMLNLIENFDMKERTSLNVHRLVEVLKFGFAARTKVCDPLFNNSTYRIGEISTKAYADTIFGNITDYRTHPPEYYKPEYDVLEDHGTSHSSVVDKNGMILDPNTGIILNNEMDDFSTPGVPNAFGLRPSLYNYPEPGKRPLSSTAPTIVEHEDVSFFLALGGSGGSRIFGAVFQVLLNLDWGLNLSDAIEFGRLHDQLFPLTMDADDVYPPDILMDLKGRGHNITVSDVNRVAAVVQAVMREGEFIFAASNSRKNGIAAGY
ncbi:uncharacterized protein LACBIDRAFT_310211 [Laccaria bicolor S238N-H82]|uniref:Glutathione hydrolase n=1 Tax=Laccaria bicolor (strain S238N-H82 / ATCC MYA-4686) TaxID=486041 RepID=B0DTQ3_LACBS|nr:uncharacterized protein LACBIDRAFT_310211 [Laccaria bicolor S238N-H82]EDR01952.1 predicted protein [Laccaria bicolor S238N-H82]|eukprot:XP_001887343.1 predicted protein [Laccaria bicolor S238N-H82]